ncbi:MAG: RagB/SusD family nutrient uptake outer membrane protein [Bacteroidota bacterium]|nr:RagB/SusD family nutrient uptake outer membrane protein [Bacteroidota bacterium]MDP4214971.1 RagB/SusD family nutrient uptake outer membrane protein [Bacteroidota bacterium]MDP4244650.1 RagB/SusD family nutrient uptake outer membrane protein [Bacteroidota bacterium]MDP4254993.1 RagB/SusD family nutrient uptake outer membrane protein [Bacteroidota bacterium]MDP4258654.1 RagB/SusD family nutrient uptake outer membrane protein [Bacteroidota bacterium]
MKKDLFKIGSMAVSVVTLLSACTKDLNRNPINSTTAANVYSTVAGCKQALAKVYGAYALTSSNGSGASDLGGIDAGTSDFVRLLWDAQELSTDEAVCAWNDPGVPDFHNMNWTSGNVILDGLYSRCLYQITVANSFIINTADANLGAFAAADQTTIKQFRAEARFLRAFQYWVLMDLFANPPFTTEKSPIGASFLPPQTDRTKLFAYVEGELLDLDKTNAMVAAKQNEYGRADQAAVWALLARLYLNAEVYLGTGNGRYTDAITYSSKVINAGYVLLPNYRNLFLADNNTNNTEQILSIAYDGQHTQNYGGTTFIINASIGGSMTPANYGVPGGGWGGNRVTSTIPSLFPDVTGSTDKRALFYTNGQSETINSIATFTNGYAVTKFQNVNSNGTTPTNASVYASTDFPLFRLAEQYLIYAEAVLRGGTGGSQAQAITYINKLRERAYGNANGDVTSLTLQDVLNERGRELYWECFRRTDLIRYGLFTGNSYLWPWKGGVSSGTNVDGHFNVFPLPSVDLAANPNLIQNKGY